MDEACHSPKKETDLVFFFVFLAPAARTRRVRCLMPDSPQGSAWFSVSGSW
jgi:hypothetical protein